MPSVYNTDNFKGRVNLAASYIAQKRRSSRTFDTCFEMHDGDLVAVALFRRAEARPDGPLARNLFHYLSENTVRQSASDYALVATRDLGKEAAKVRAKAHADFDTFMAKQALGTTAGDAA